jgi:WD40 repeat protein
MEFSPNSRWLVAQHDEARLWDMQSDDPEQQWRVLPGHSNFVASVAFSPDSRWLVTASWDKKALIWDLAAEHPEESFVKLDHKTALYSVAISPDGRWVVTGAEDGTARMWDLTAENPAASSLVLRGHRGSIISLAISPDCRWVITGSYDTTVRLWDLNIDSLMQRGRRLVGRELTALEREEYMIDTSEIPMEPVPN